VAQYVRDLHQCIIECIAEKKRRAAVFAPDDEIADVIGQETLGTMHQVLELDALPGGHPEAQARPAPGRQPGCALLGVQLAAGAGVARRLAGRDLRPPHQIQLKAAAEARVCQPLAFQPLKILLVDGAALRLPVRPVRAGDIWPLVPRESQPRQVDAQRGHHILLGARRIGILDAQHEAAGVPLRQQVVEQRGARIAQVQCAAGAGRKARDDGVLGHYRYNVA